MKISTRLADGWLPLFFLPEKAGDVWGAALAAGKAMRATELGTLDVEAGGIVGFDDRAKNVLEMMGRWMINALTTPARTGRPPSARSDR